MKEDWGDIFRNLQFENIEDDQREKEETVDIGEDTEEYMDFNHLKETEIPLAGHDSKVFVRSIRHGWLLQVRKSAIKKIVETAGELGLRKLTVFTAVIYVDRYLSLMPIKDDEELERPELVATACLSMASEIWEEPNIQMHISQHEEVVTGLDAESLQEMKNIILEQFEGLRTCITPIQFIKYFLSLFCKDDSRKDYARIKTVELIMSILGDLMLMRLRPMIVAAAATLLASNPNILSVDQIKAEIEVVPKKWIDKFDEVCLCYYTLLGNNYKRLDISF